MKVNGTAAKSVKKQFATTGGTPSDLSVAQELKANETYLFQYDGTYWVLMTTDYNTNSTYTLSNIPEGSGGFVADSAIYRYQLLFQRGGSNSGKITPLNNNGNVTGNTKTMLTGITFNPFGKIYYYSTTTTVAAGSVANGSYLCPHYSGINLRYTFNAPSLTGNSFVYLEVTPQSDGTVTIASASPLTQTLPSTDTGNWYILLGIASSNYQMTLYFDHPVYRHNGTEIVEVFSKEVEAGIKDAVLPSYSVSDAGKVLRVSSTGTLEWVSPSTIYTGSGTPQQSLGNDGDIYLQTS